MIRLVIIEDEELIRLGITTAINQQTDMEMIGSACTGREGINLVEELNPDVVLLDIGLPDINGLEVIEKIKHTNSRIVVLSSHLVPYALEKGAHSYILKKNNIPLILEAIKITHAGQLFLDSEIVKGHHPFFSHQKIKGKTYNERLTSTEINVLTLIASGFSNKKIGEHLFIAESTVKNHTSNIYSKLGVTDRVNAIIKATKLGYLQSNFLRVS